jgi:hypothetical protein
MISDADDTQMLRRSKVVRKVNMKGVMKAALAHVPRLFASAQSRRSNHHSSYSSSVAGFVFSSSDDETLVYGKYFSYLYLSYGAFSACIITASYVASTN